MRESKFRYQLQVSVPEKESWENRFSGASCIANHPENLSNRVWDMIARNKATLETIRIWDNQENEVVEIPISCSFNPALVLERNERRVLRQAEEDLRLAKLREASEINYRFQQVEQEIAREALEHVVLENVDQFNELPRIQREILVGDIAEAYQSTDIDGYGDEGEGYNVDEFLQKLIALGWKYDPEK